MNIVSRIVSFPVRFAVRHYRSWRNSRHNCLKRLFDYDRMRLEEYCGDVLREEDQEALRASIVVHYHVIEKGLTMPNRHLKFGRDVMLMLIELVDRFDQKWRVATDRQVQHAVEVVREYWELHKEYEKKDDSQYWDILQRFLDRHSDIQASRQHHFSAEEFCSKIDSPFSEMCFARHTVRNYAGPVSEATVREAVRLAATAPSACNRQHARVYLVSDATMKAAVLSLQNGNRGFGHLAGNVLVLTGDLRDLVGINERHDVFTNVGMFMMNLCYAFYCLKVAYCILNWSVVPKRDRELRKLLKIPESEVVVALMTIGALPKEFDVALSPNRAVSEILKVVE